MSDPTRARWRAEKESAWLYEIVAAHEGDPRKARAFRALGEAAERQAAILAGDLGESPRFAPSVRARVVAMVVRWRGPERAKTMLAAMKVRGVSMYLGAVSIDQAPPPAGGAAGGAQAPAGGHPTPTWDEHFEARHRPRKESGFNLRAAVFGVNDGLLSNTSLILGVAGAGAEPRSVLLTGIAGLLSGAFSMGAGELVSVQAQRELYEHQIAEESAELERYPDEEAEELARVYEGRGVPLEDARAMTTKLVKNKPKMLATLAREELGLNPDDLGSAWAAAISSFVSFAIGALVPLAPFLVGAGRAAILVAVALAAVALSTVGAALSLFSGHSAVRGGARMLAIGAIAGSATYGIGQLIGVSIS